MRYAGIIKNDVVNGYDVCVSFWCQGCVFECEGCHNPQTWDFNGGIEGEEDNIINEIISDISKNGIQRNFSILGGEPLCDKNVDFIYKLIQEVRKVYPDIKIFCWTGYIWEGIFSSATLDWLEYQTFQDLRKEIVKSIDVLIDGRYEKTLRDITLPFRGSSNQRVIDVKKSLEAEHIELYSEEQ